jgi:hypothetical protein
MTKRSSSQSYRGRLAKSLKNWPVNYWRKNWWHKLVSIVVALVMLCIGTMYGIAQWYIHSESGKQIFGVSFIPDYATYLGVDPQEIMDSLIGIGVKQFRLTSYWGDYATAPGQYDFSGLDWQFQKAEKAGAKISLSVGLRQPRWPECHMPDWAAQEPQSQWQAQLQDYVTAVVNRYKHSPALESYQIENEYFLKGFGICDNIPGAEDRQRLVDEFNLVKKLDPTHTLIVNRSNNALGWPIGQPQPDMFGISIYKRVWDGNLTHRYLEYPQPAWYYGFVAGWQKIMTGKDMIIHELQAEAWAPAGQDIKSSSLAEQNKSLNAKRLQDRFGYGKATGMPQIYLWGAEYWYYRMQVLHDPSLWNVAQQEFGKQ